MTFIQQLNEFIVNRINKFEEVLNKYQEEHKSPYCAEGIAASAALDELYELKDFIKRNVMEGEKIK